MRLHHFPFALLAFLLVFLLGIATAVPAGAQAPPLHVCATTPGLGDLVRQVGGDRVQVKVFAKGVQDPHFVEARPSFIKAMSKADLFVQVGMDLELGWAPLLLKGCRNPRVQRGAPGYLDASLAIRPMEVPAAAVDRSQGDVHARGNPHYLLDPLNGLAVARLIATKLSDLRPAEKATFDANLSAFRKRLGVRMVGKVADLYDFEKLAQLDARGKLGAFLAQQGDSAAFGGWLKDLAPYRGTTVVADHDMWPYMAARFGLRVVGFMEPLPGVPPTTRHLAALVDQMKQQHVRLIFSAPYYDPRHAHFISERTGARVVLIAHQVDSRPGTSDYLSMVDYNVHQIIAALADHE